MLNDDTHAQHICNNKRVVLFRVALFLLNACLSQNLYISSVFFSRCNNTCTSFSKCYIIKQLFVFNNCIILLSDIAIITRKMMMFV